MRPRSPLCNATKAYRSIVRNVRDRFEGARPVLAANAPKRFGVGIDDGFEKVAILGR